MKKYAFLASVFIKNCFMMETEYRLNFILWIFVNLLWGFFRFFAVFFLFQNLGNIAGWTTEEALILSLVANITMSILWVFILPNLLIFPELIQKGDLDFVLLKPINSRFMVSTRYFEFDQIGRLIIAPILILILLSVFNFQVSAVNILTSIIVLFGGVFALYNVYFMIITTSFWFNSMENLQNVLYSLNDAGQIPGQIYGGVFKLIFFFIIPVIFIATIPTQVLLGKTGPIAIPVTIFAGILTFAISQWFWNFSIKKYSSASS